MCALKKQIKKCEISLRNTEKTMEQYKTNIQQKKHIILQIQQKQKTISTMGPKASCPTCERVLGDQHELLIKKYENETKKNQDEMSVLQWEIL